MCDSKAIEIQIVKWFLLALPGCSLILLAIWLYEQYQNRVQAPTRFAQMRAMVDGPVLIDGEERQPRLRRVQK